MCKMGVGVSTDETDPQKPKIAWMPELYRPRFLPSCGSVRSEDDVQLENIVLLNDDRIQSYKFRRGNTSTGTGTNAAKTK